MSLDLLVAAVDNRAERPEHESEPAAATTSSDPECDAFCYACRKPGSDDPREGGDLISCDSCSLAFHVSCRFQRLIKPPASFARPWRCQFCECDRGGRVAVRRDGREAAADRLAELPRHVRAVRRAVRAARAADQRGGPAGRIHPSRVRCATGARHRAPAPPPRENPPPTPHAGAAAVRQAASLAGTSCDAQRHNDAAQ